MANSTPALHIFALGPPEVRLGEDLVAFPTRKTLALLIYLASEAGLQPRERLATMLWPEANPGRSYASLRNTLRHVQTALCQVNGLATPPYLSITHHALGLNPAANIVIDLQTVDRAYALARADRSSRMLPDGLASLPFLLTAAACQRGDFLAGFSLGDAPGFDDWAASQSEIWRRRLGLILDRLSEIQFASGDFASATETASRWIALDGLNEVAYRRKIRAHFAAGERGQALETYEACQAVLAAELGIEPEPDTDALAERIRTQPVPAHPAAHYVVPQVHRPDTSVAFLENLFAGRASELQTLMNTYQRAVAGKPQLVVLRGEVGIGKTRLARKFIHWACEQECELLLGSAFESGSHIPFQPLVDALRLRLVGENSPKDLLDEVWLTPLIQLLPELRQSASGLSTIFDEQATLAKEHSHPEIEISQTQHYEPFVQYTLALARRAPLVLFVDDLQWADSTTLDLLQYAIRRWRDNTARILFLVSLRSEALHPLAQHQPRGGPQNLGQWLERVGRELSPVHMELEPFGEQETIQLALSILSPPVADFAQWLYDETHGQPYYLMETLKDLLERCVLHPKRQPGRGWSFAVDAEHDLGQAVRVPSTVHAVIRSRLNRLSPNAFSLLASAAVLEQQITFERLCVIANVGVDLALPALDELISSRLLLEAVQPGVPSAYKFANDMLRDVVYTEAGDARRRLFHRRALETLEVAGDSAAVLAHHALAAGLAKIAFQHSLAAGREALQLTAVSEAIVHFEHARQFLREVSQSEMPDPVGVRELYLLLGRAYAMGGQKEMTLATDLEKYNPVGEAAIFMYNDKA